MFFWAVVFLIVALISGVLGLTGISGMSQEIAWVLFFFGLIFAALSFILGRRF